MCKMNVFKSKVIIRIVLFFFWGGLCFLFFLDMNFFKKNLNFKLIKYLNIYSIEV